MNQYQQLQDFSNKITQIVESYAEGTESRLMSFALIYLGILLAYDCAPDIESAEIHIKNCLKAAKLRQIREETE